MILDLTSKQLDKEKREYMSSEKSCGLEKKKKKNI